MIFTYQSADIPRGPDTTPIALGLEPIQTRSDDESALVVSVENISPTEETTMKAPRVRRGSKLPVLIAAALSFTTFSCTVSVSPAPDGTGGPLTVSFQLGQAGAFTITAGIPFSNSARITGLAKPDSTPEVAVLRLGADSVTVTPLSTSQTLGTDLNGMMTLTFQLGAESSDDPCATGESLGSIHATIVDGLVVLAESELTLSPTALAHVATGGFTLCITVEGDFDAVVTIGGVTVVFDPDGAGPTGDSDGGEVDDGDEHEGDGAGDDDPQVDSDDDADDSMDDNEDPEDTPDGNADDDTPVDNNDDPDADDTGDDQGDDQSEDNPTGSALTYVNFTNDVHLEPYTSFDSFNKYATIDDSGNVVAYLSNVDAAGTDGEVPSNQEVVVRIGATRVQVTNTTETTNTADNTYWVSNWGPVVSADGAIVVFGSDGNVVNGGPDATDQIYLYEVDTGQLRQLSALDTPSGGIQKDWVGYPRVGGNAVAWIENDTECPTFGCSQQERLRVTDRDGNDVLTVPLGADLTLDHYSLPGDGETIVFVSSRDPVGLNPDGYAQLFSMSVGGGSVSQLSSIASSQAGWTPFYRVPAVGPHGDLITVWTNDPAITSTEELVLALLDAQGGLIRILARAGEDFPSGDDDTFRARFCADGSYVAFATSWSFGYTQRNFRAATDGSELLELGIGYKAVSPTMTSDGFTVVITGSGYEFFPEQSFQNEDLNDEVWLVNIAP